MRDVPLTSPDQREALLSQLKSVPTKLVLGHTDTHNGFLCAEFSPTNRRQGSILSSSAGTPNSHPT